MVSDWLSSDTQLFTGIKSQTLDSKSESEVDYAYQDSLILTTKRHHIMQNHLWEALLGYFELGKLQDSSSSPLE